MRHVRVHDHFAVDWDEVFDTAQRDVPPLKAKSKPFSQTFLLKWKIRNE